jgi:hypothetical protein
MEKKYKITITLGHLDKEYEVDEDQLINNDWNTIIEDMLDSVKP